MLYPIELLERDTIHHYSGACPIREFRGISPKSAPRKHPRLSCGPDLKQLEVYHNWILWQAPGQCQGISPLLLINQEKSGLTTGV